MSRLDQTKTVFILGAGASVHCRVPVMKDFLDEAYRLRRYSDIQLTREAFDIVFEAISSLSNVYAKSQLQLRNIESVFAAFEMATLFERLGRLDGNGVKRLVPALKTLILETIEITQEFPQIRSTISASSAYEGLVGLTGKLLEGHHEVTVLTFNYDVGIDFAFQRSTVKLSYELQDSEDKSVAVLKLHGSLNWAHCPKCSAITPKEIVATSFEAVDKDASRIRLRHSLGINWTSHCEGAQREQPFIVPPTWNKSQHYSAISPVWRQAAEKLRHAENIIVIGYSLPDTDQFFRYLYALGTAGDARLQRFWVFNPDTSVDERFRNLLGPLAVERYLLNPDGGVGASGHGIGTFESAINYVTRKLAKE